MKYIIEEAKGTDGSEIQVYAGYSLETKVDDMECLKQYKYRFGSEMQTKSFLYNRFEENIKLISKLECSRQTWDVFANSFCNIW